MVKKIEQADTLTKLIYLIRTVVRYILIMYVVALYRDICFWFYFLRVYVHSYDVSVVSTTYVHLLANAIKIYAVS